MIAADLNENFIRLRALFTPVAPACVLLHDEPHRFTLGTHDVRAKDFYRIWFGGVEIKKAYVSAHLMPVYMHPDLLTPISDALKKRMQGKACFNFKYADEGLFAEFGILVKAGAERFAGDGRIRREDLLF